MFKLFKRDAEEYNYFRTFKAISLLIIDAYSLIISNFKNDQLDSLEEILNEIKTIEKSGFHQKKELLNYLYKDFLPPIERKSLIGLTHSLDAILKNTVNLIVSMDIYQVKSLQPTILELIELLVNASEELPQLMKDLEDFKHPQKIRFRTDEVNQIIVQGTQINHQGVKNLYLGDMSLSDTMKYTKVYESFEEVFASIESLLNTVEAVIIENT